MSSSLVFIKRFWTNGITIRKKEAVMTHKSRVASVSMAAALSGALLMIAPTGDSYAVDPGKGVSKSGKHGQSAAYAVLKDSGVTLATATFIPRGDRFYIHKSSTDPDHHRAYVHYKYTRKNGQQVEGRRWGHSKPDSSVYVKGPNFGEHRYVEFQVCVQQNYWKDPCSGYVRASTT